MLTVKGADLVYQRVLVARGVAAAYIVVRDTRRCTKRDSHCIAF